MLFRSVVPVGLGKEVVVLEKAEDEQVDEDVAPQGPAASGGGEVRVADDQAGEETAERSKGYEEEKTPVPPAIEKVGGRHNKGILPAQLSPQEPIDEERYWQKDNEFNRVEQHIVNCKDTSFF